MADHDADLPRWGIITEPMTVFTNLVLALLAFVLTARLAYRSAAVGSAAAASLTGGLLATALLIAACGGTTASPTPGQLTQVQLQLQWEPQAQFAGYFAADAQGYYAAEGLDVEMLQQQVLGPLLGIDDPRTSERITFAGGIRGTDYLKQQVDKNGGVAFSMHPVTVEQLMAIADAGRIMPPKSTWFEPKLRSGLFVHTF